MRLLQENGKDLTDDEANDGITSKILSALGIMNTLGTLILSVETKPDLLRALENCIQPVLVFVLDNGIYGRGLVDCRLISDLMTEVFEIIDSLTFSTRSISPTMWSFFPLLHAAFEEYATDYIEGSNPFLPLTF